MLITPVRTNKFYWILGKNYFTSFFWQDSRYWAQCIVSWCTQVGNLWAGILLSVGTLPSGKVHRFIGLAEIPTHSSIRHNKKNQQNFTCSNNSCTHRWKCRTHYSNSAHAKTPHVLTIANFINGTISTVNNEMKIDPNIYRKHFESTWYEFRQTVDNKVKTLLKTFRKHVIRVSADSWQQNKNPYKLWSPEIALSHLPFLEQSPRDYKLLRRHQVFRSPIINWTGSA